MNNTATRKQWIGALLSISLILAVIIGGVITKPQKEIPADNTIVKELPEEPLPEVEELPEEPLTDFALLMKETMEQLEKQDEMDEIILSELHSGAYTFDNPLIIVDPYDASPLTALAIFTSAEPLNVSIHIEGKTELANVDYTFEGYNTEHIIPIYGLYANTDNKVDLTARDELGQERQTELEVTTGPLMQKLSNAIVLTNLRQPDKYQEGLNFTYADKSAFDVNGDYRWFFPAIYEISINYHYNDWFIGTRGDAYQGETLVFLVNMLGKINRVLYTTYGNHHYIEILEEGRVLITGSSGDTIEDFIYELNLETGMIDATLDLKQVLQRSRELIVSAENRDWFHNNAITLVKDTNKIIISGRHQGVMQLSWPDGKLDWILSTHDGWVPMFEQYLLTPLGRDFEWPYGQHAPVILPDYDNNPDTIDILLFDNGNNRFDKDMELQRKIRNNEITEPELYSRMVHYRIDEKNKTVEQIWQFGKEYGMLLYSDRCGSAYLLPNGNRLGAFDRQLADHQTDSELCFEVSEDNDIVWEAHIASKNSRGSYWEYRIERMSIYSDSSNRLAIGEPAKNLIPLEVLEKYGYK